LKFKGIPKSVVVLGFVSFLTDMSSDMIYPLLPIFLVQYLGASQGFIGLIEGIAESTAAFFTLVSGVMADRAKDRSKLVLGGYTLSSICRPLVALAWTPWVVLFIRFADRVGKGIRTSPRDALIADSVAAEHRGKAFGLQRSLDHAGAIAGPITASLLLAGWITNLRILFALAAIPGIFAVLLIIWKVREVRVPDGTHPRMPISLKIPQGRLRIYFAIYFLFILSCSSDAFLFLRCAELGMAPMLIPIVWMIFNVVKAGTTMPLGALSDLLGRRHVLLAGWVVYALIYLGFGLASVSVHAWILFALYGLFYGFTEGTERAILADYSNPQERGQVYGWHYLIVGMGSLPASFLFGTLWQRYGSKAAFLTSASISTIAAVLLFIFMKKYPAPARASQQKALQ
jgi:MFS family permease